MARTTLEKEKSRDTVMSLMPAAGRTLFTSDKRRPLFGYRFPLVPHVVPFPLICPHHTLPPSPTSQQ